MTFGTPLVFAPTTSSGSNALGQTLTTLADLRSCVRLKLGDEPAIDFTTGAVNASTVTIPVNDMSLWGKGTKLVWDDSPERSLVTATAGSSGAGDITVIRGTHGSSASSHASGALLLVEPRFTPSQIDDAINGCIAGLYPSVYAPMFFTVTPSSTVTKSAVPDDFEFLISVVQKGISSTDPSQAQYDHSSGLHARIIPADAGTYSNGRALEFSSYDNTTNSVYVTYGAQLTNATIPALLGGDCVCWGAVKRLAAGHMMQFTAPDRNEDGRSTSGADLSRAYATAKNEYDYLLQRWKVQLRGVARPARRYLNG